MFRRLLILAAMATVASITAISCATPEQKTRHTLLDTNLKPALPLKNYTSYLTSAYSYPPKFSAIGKSPERGHFFTDNEESLSGFGHQLRGLNRNKRRLRLAEEVPIDLYSVTSGGTHSCALKKKYRRAQSLVKCWGYNSYGQIGAGLSTPASNIPLPVSGLPNNITKIAAGYFHTCAISEGNVWCWGDNSSKQLGLEDVQYSPRARKVPGLQHVVEISVGGYHNCARMEFPTQKKTKRNPATVAHTEIACWGSNTEGQLGIGTSSDAKTVTVLNNIPGSVRSLSAGFSHQCALLSDGRAACWGLNYHGQLGLGHTQPQSTPAIVRSLGKSIEAIAAGFYHTCAQADGQVYCWGLNSRGQFGNGATSDEPAMTAVATQLARVDSLEMGWASGYAIRDEKLLAWGLNDYSEVTAAPSEHTSTLDPTLVTQPVELELSQVMNVSAGVVHSCAVAQHKIWCWGDNSAGELGSGDPMEGTYSFRLVLF